LIRGNDTTITGELLARLIQMIVVQMPYRQAVWMTTIRTWRLNPGEA
jgi:hypothetical protein